MSYLEFIGKPISFWVFSPVRKEWIQLSDPTFPQGSIILDLDNSVFIRFSRWLGLGALLFPLGVDPNKSMQPIILPESYLKTHGIKLDDLYQATINGTLASFSVNTRAIPKQSVETVTARLEATKAKIISTKDVIDSMLKGEWVDLELVKPRLPIIQKKYKIVIEGEKATIQM